MGFMDKVKQFFGIGGVKVELKCAPSFAKASGAVNGEVVLSSKSDQSVQKVVVKVVESYSSGRGENKSTKEFDLGEAEVAGSFDLKAGETKTLTFQVPFQMLKSNNDMLKEKGGALGALGKLGSFADGEKSEYSVVVSADVKGTAFGPGDKKAIQLS